MLKTSFCYAKSIILIALYTESVLTLLLRSVTMTNWNYTTDVLIVGSGGGGMTAALVAKKAGLIIKCVGCN